MKIKKTNKPIKSKFCVFRQICNLIPPHLIPSLARKHGVASQSYTPWSHVVTMMYAQFTRAIGLNDVCDSLKWHSGLLLSLRGARGPSRNALSYANKKRPSAMAEALLWKVLAQPEQAS